MRSNPIRKCEIMINSASDLSFLDNQKKKASEKRTALKQFVERMIEKGQWGASGTKSKKFLAYVRIRLRGCLGCQSDQQEAKAEVSSRSCMVEVIENVSSRLNKLKARGRISTSLKNKKKKQQNNIKIDQNLKKEKNAEK